ncbi:CDP-diacylglycerol--glycerol-3-phosphate 3-phosphatidyltransferase [Clostridiisalibacter paucivorans]|uniref:CDP-diacylglycerol--glycerol-3-phosphate 3-phosphatidyltransferase n=1 Tax=Clostridiisalibacter paucivorans TaxID=408753 RepID=UPI00047D33C8|nr:CDP-diacylglycerol--glycerol-3-phosphate 3-phosphatidyltransferase [Clostridiisalibacter paucivorans]
MNIPNTLTIIRFFLIPVFLYVFYSNIENNVLYGTYIFLLAGVTDILDGYIARKYDLITKWGIILDPLADKLMLLVVLIGFTSKGYLPIFVILIVGIKEILMIAGGIFLYYFMDKTVIPANKFGKIATVSFYVAIFSVALKISDTVSFISVGIAITLTLIAFINYFMGFESIKNNRVK